MAGKKTVYIGEFPPPYGGVTVKNALLFDQVFASCDTDMIDMVECKRKPWTTPIIACRVALGMLMCKGIIIGVGSTKRRKILLCLEKILSWRTGLKKTMLIVMGGQFHEKVAQDNMLYRLLKDVGSIWVESESMIRAFQEMGIEQTYFFPNCRDDAASMMPVPCECGKLKLVFFSRICAAKGVEDIISAFESLGEEVQNVTLDFYGELDADIKEDFLNFVERNEHVSYHGVFDAVHGNLYAELNQYDAMLLLTSWVGEGVPGALVESKMAGITAIVSDWRYNSETVLDGVEGIVLSMPYAEHLANAIRELMNDCDRLNRLKQGAYESRKRYCIDTYRETLIQKIFQ